MADWAEPSACVLSSQPAPTGDKVEVRVDEPLALAIEARDRQLKPIKKGELLSLLLCI